MKSVPQHALALAGALGLAGALVVAAAGADTPAIEIVAPTAGALVSGRTRIEVQVAPGTPVRVVNVFVDGRLVCTREQPPFACDWDAGTVVRGHHVRVVATLDDGSRVVRNVRTTDPGYTERATVEAVLVPVIVTDGGQFVRGLKAQDFRVVENGVPQRVASFVDEDAPLDLVVAVDISGSMEQALPDVKASVKQLLSRLRPGDAVTLLGFNDTIFIAAERESDSRAREEAVDLLASFGGTALYDATLRAVELVGKRWGRKGIVIFSDGDDRNSLASRDAVLERVEASDAMIYTVGFGAGAVNPRLRASLEAYARATGGRAFFPRDAGELDPVFDRIVAELAHQYVLSYSSTNEARDGKWREIKVELRDRKHDVRARRGYRAGQAEQARR